MPLTEYNFGSENRADLIFYAERDVKKSASLFYYEAGGTVQRLIHGLKYRGQEQVGEQFGRWMGEVLCSDPFLPRPDWVVPVPLHWRRLLERGYNQCHGMARAISEKTGGRYSSRILTRHKYRRTQTGRGRGSRWAGSEGAFRVRNPSKLEGSRILLIDDVITTGATLRACCQAFERVKDIELYIASLAVVP